MNDAEPVPGRAPEGGVRLIIACWAALVHTALLMAIVLFLFFIVPGYERLFEEMCRNLPLPTRLSLAASALLRGYWFLVPPAAFVFFVLDTFVAFGLLSLRSARFVRCWFYLGSLALIGAVVLSFLSVLLPIESGEIENQRETAREGLSPVRMP